MLPCVPPPYGDSIFLTAPSAPESAATSTSPVAGMGCGGSRRADGNSALSGSQERTNGIFVLARNRKSQQQRVFLRVAVIVRAAARNLKTEFLVQRYGGSIGFADFEKDLFRRRSCRIFEEVAQKKSGVALPATSRID